MLEELRLLRKELQESRAAPKASKPASEPVKIEVVAPKEVPKPAPVKAAAPPKPQFIEYYDARTGTIKKRRA